MSEHSRAPSHSTSLLPGTNVNSPVGLYLRAEQAAAESPDVRSLLLHELGVVEERAGDELGAARDFLAAFNSYAQFREPLEGLVRLLERRKSVKNLPKLLDALLRAADTPVEKSRALIKKAAFAIDYRKDDESARGALLEATSERPDDATGWLELEVLAGRVGDAALRISALEARAALETNPTWRALLLVGLAELVARQGDDAQATSFLSQAMKVEGAARFRAAHALERHAGNVGDTAALTEALETQAELVINALANPQEGDRFGVPRALRIVEVAADAWIRAAEARKTLGDLAAAGALLDRALEHLGPESAILSARLAVAEAAGDTGTAERLAETMLDQGIKGSGAASLFMRVAEAAANRDDAQGALSALNKALEADPGCIPARALEVDLLGNATDAAALAGALEAMASELPSDEAKGRAYLLSAYVFAAEARDVAGARAALSQAGSSGVAPAVLGRTARWLATLVGDPAWYEDATKRLIASGAEDDERLGLWFELGRARLLRGDQGGARAAFEALAPAGGGWLGPALAAYVLGHRGSESGDAARAVASPEPLDLLSLAEPNPAFGRALSVAAARRADLGGDAEQAVARLRALFEAQPGDLIVAVYLADLEKRVGRPLESAKVLSSAASALPDLELGAALHLESALLLWRCGQRRVALDELESALLGTATPVAPLFGWALRAIEATSTDEKRRLLDRAAEFSPDDPLLFLERFAVQLLSPGGAPSSHEILESVESKAEGELSTATVLARILWTETSGDRDQLTALLARLAEKSPQAAAIASWENLNIARKDGEPARALAHAEALARSLGSVPAILEWLGAATATGDRKGEVLARRALAGALSGEARSAVLASAALVALIETPDASHPLLPFADDVSRLMNLELAPPGRDARRRATALCSVGDALGEEAGLDAMMMAGYNHLAFGDAAEAISCFAAVVAVRKTDLFSWEGFRSAALALGDVEKQALACSELGELASDDAKAAELWERAALLYLDELSDEPRGEAALERAFERDPTRKTAFDRWFRRIRERRESDKLLTIIAKRLEVADEPDEIAKLFWERARVLREKGDRDGALTALENVTMIEPDHVGALALKGEIAITQSNFASAAENLARLASLEQAPEKQRLMSGVAAVDLYENKLDDTVKALEVLVGLHMSGLSTLPVRERLARAAAKTGSWEHATAILEELMKERATAEGRIEAARLAMAIWRDKLNQPEGAENAVAKLLDESPDDGEALDLVFLTEFSPEVKKHLLVRGRAALIEALAEEPIDAVRIERLARIAKATGDWPLRQATLGALRAVTGPDPIIEQELDLLDLRVAKTPQVAVDAATIGLIGAPEDTGALPDLFAALAESLAAALGPSLETLGVGKKQKVDPRSGLPLRNEIVAWAGALGLGEFDLYIGGHDPNAVQGIAGEVPALVVGGGITTPLAPAGRQALVRELFALRRGIGITRSRDETTIAAIVVAACNLAEVRIESPPYAMLGDVQRQLGRALSRRTRKTLPPLCRAVVDEGRDIREWGRAALTSMYRMATIAAGDVSLVLTDALGVPLSRLPSLLEHDERGRPLVAFVLSPQYLALRGKLGMGVQ